MLFLGGFEKKKGGLKIIRTFLFYWLTQYMVWRYVALTQHLAMRGYVTLTAVREPSDRGARLVIN